MGNEKADATAKSARSLTQSIYKISYTDFRISISTYGVYLIFLAIPVGCTYFQQTSVCEASPWQVVPLLQVHSSRRGDKVLQGFELDILD